MKTTQLDLSIQTICAQLPLCVFAQKYLPKCKDTYFILQNKYLRIYADSLGAKVLEMIVHMQVRTCSFYALFCHKMILL